MWDPGANPSLKYDDKRIRVFGEKDRGLKIYNFV